MYTKHAYPTTTILTHTGALSSCPRCGQDYYELRH